MIRRRHMNPPASYLKRIIVLIFLILAGFGNTKAQSDLSYYIKTAQSNSPILNEYNNQIFANRIDSLKLRATYGFIVTGEGIATYAPIVKGWGYDNALSNGQSLFSGVRVAKEFISRNNLNTRLENYKISIEQQLAQKDISIQTLNQQITDQYIATYSSQQLYELNQEIIYLLKQEDIVLKELTQATVFKQTDYLSFKVILQQNELALQQQTADWQNNYILLNYLSGVVDTTFVKLNPPDIDDTVSSSFEASMYAKAFKADSLKLANDAKIIEYNYRSKVTAFSDGGYWSSFVISPYKNFGFSIGLAITLPIYDGHQKKMLIEQNQLSLQTRQKYLSQTQHQYQQKVLQLKIQIGQYERMIITANEQINYARTLVEANARQLPTGDVKMVDFILSIDNLLNLKANIIQFNTMLFRLRNQLKYLII